MINKSVRTIQFPVKVGEDERVATYAASLINGEEQVLVTRSGKLFLTNGTGGFLDFRSNSIYTREEMDAILKTNSDNIDGVVRYINSEISSTREYALGMHNSLDNKINTSNINISANSEAIARNLQAIMLNAQNIAINAESIRATNVIVAENKNSIESDLKSFKSETGISILNIEDSIRSILEKIQGSNLNITDILKLIGDLTLLSEDIKAEDIVSSINNVYNQAILGKHLIADAINYKMSSLNADGSQSYLELSELIREIKTGGFGGPAIEDFSEHTSLPSFSKHAKLNTFEAKE